MRNLRSAFPQRSDPFKPRNTAIVFVIMTDLERSHAELRAAVILARKRIVKLNFGRKEDPVLTVLRRVLRDARAVAVRKELPFGFA